MCQQIWLTNVLFARESQPIQFNVLVMTAVLTISTDLILIKDIESLEIVLETSKV